MDPRYDHTHYEQRIYEHWESSGAFTPPPPAEAAKRGQKPFSIILPPPNANDPLHVGHAMYTVEDVFIRYHRMLGDATLWLPGTDHAGIETQYVFEKKLAKQGKSRFNFDRETLYHMIWEYVQENSDIAVNQLKRLGFSLDWTRRKFTLDDDCVDLTLQTFETMHRDGLVYRDLGLVNYCSKCGTGYSELEIKRVEQTNPLYYLKYGQFTIATARPETKFRDTALAVNPNDPRYKDEIGKTYEITGLLGPIAMTVIADEDVDPEFGTGIMKVTPAHDPHDFELGKRYNLPVTPIIDFQGKMDFSWFIEAAGERTESNYVERAKKYHGKKVLEARQLMVEDLRADGLLVNIDATHLNAVATCYRCNTILEPLPLAQFFVQVKPLTKQALAVLDRGETVVYGAGHDKILRHWLENLRDWNISRQIVWGIRMPVWYEIRSKVNDQRSKTNAHPNDFLVVGFLDKEGKYISGLMSELLQDHDFALIKQNLQTLTAPPQAKYVVSREAPGPNYLQETDTFDTWFSSSQWPVNTLKTTGEGDFDFYYPTSVLETAYDILMFWVMRMMLMGLYLTGKTPFETVYLHGLIRDEKGQKMSKSKGNVINPLDLVEKYGADSLRMALVISSVPGQGAAVGESKVKGMRNFSNKIWNAARFIKMNQQSQQVGLLSHSGVPPLAGEEASAANQEVATASPRSFANAQDDSLASFTSKLHAVITEVTEHLEHMRPGQAAEVVHNEFWHWFCDECIEQTKQGQLSAEALENGFKTFLLLLHPFVPFVTEAAWQELGYAGLLIAQPWPTTYD